MVYIFLGVPGSGKGTIAKNLVKQKKYKHLSTGDLFRYHIKNKTDLGKEVMSVIDSGKLVNDNLTNQIAKEEILTYDNNEVLLLDGYPRTLNQAKFLNDLLINNNIDFKYSIYLNISKDEVIKRLSSRYVSKSGNTYNRDLHKIKNINEKYFVKDEEVYQREDDKPENVKKRFEEYLNKTTPLIKYYKDMNKLLEIDANNKPKKIYKNVLKAFK